MALVVLGRSTLSRGLHNGHLSKGVISNFIDSLVELIEHRFGVKDRVRLLGARLHSDLLALYTCLAASREGWGNFLPEGMACGIPVIASNVWGNPEVGSQHRGRFDYRAEYS